MISSAHAQTAAASGPAGLDSSFLIMMVGMFVLLYFMTIRPQMKKQKEQKAMMEGLAKGDEVITAGGMLGKITDVSDAYVVLEIANSVAINVQKAAVTTLLPKGTIKAL